MPKKQDSAIRSPKIGYESEAKRNYRESVWNSIFDQVGKCGNFLILPSKEGLEIDYLIDMGVPQCRIFCVDESPAVIATAPWRKKYKSIRAFGCKVSEVGHRLRKLGVKLSGANIDLCNNFSEELVTEVSKFLTHAPIDNDFCFSVTVAKGREQSAVNYLMNIIMESSSWRKSDYVKMSEKRIACLMRIASQCLPKSTLVRLAHQGSYIHHRTPMAYATFRLTDIEAAEEFARLYNKAAFESELIRRIDWDGIYGYSEGVARWARIMSNNPSKPDCAKHWPDLLSFIKKVKSGDLYCYYMYSCLAVKERDEICASYHRSKMGAMDWSSPCEINYRLEKFGCSASRHDSVDFFMTLYKMADKIKL